FGDSAITTFQGGAVGTAWDSSFRAVYHMGDATAFNLNDSSGHGFNGQNNGLFSQGGTEIGTIMREMVQTQIFTNAFVPNSADIVTGTQLTFATWNSAQMGTAASTFGNTGSGVSYPWMFFLAPTGTYQMYTMNANRDVAACNGSPWGTTRRRLVGTYDG